MKTLLTAGVSGVLFALGLGLAGMTDPAKVVGFLDVAGAWDPSLAFVMAGAMGTYAALRWVILGRKKPVLAPAFAQAPTTGIDRRLLAGAALFGVGWGASGYCPGPAFVSVGSSVTTAVFVAAMGAGMWLFSIWERASAAQSSDEQIPLDATCG